MYALSQTETSVKANKPKHVCGELMVSLKDGSGRYTCTRCLQSGYLITA